MNKNIIISNNISVKNEVVDASSKLLKDFKPIYTSTIISKLKNENYNIKIEKFQSEFGLLKNSNDEILKKLNDEENIAAIVAENGINSLNDIEKNNNIFVFKPSYGRTSRYGIYSYASSMDNICIYSKKIDEIINVLEIISGRDDNDLNTINSNFSMDSNCNCGENCNCEGNCKCGEDCNCSENCGCGKKCNCGENCDCGENCSCGETCKCEETCNCENECECGSLVTFGIFEEVGFPEEILNISKDVLDVLSYAEATTNLASLDGIRYGIREDGSSYDEIIKKTRSNFAYETKKNLIFGSYTLRKDNLENIYFKAMKIRREIVENIKELMDEARVLVFRKTKLEKTEEEINKIKENILAIAILAGMPFISFVKDEEEYIILANNFKEKELFEFTQDILSDESFLNIAEIEEEEEE